LLLDAAVRSVLMFIMILTHGRDVYRAFRMQHEAFGYRN
jgi:hypothetical protein